MVVVLSIWALNFINKRREIMYEFNKLQKFLTILAYLSLLSIGLLITACGATKSAEYDKFTPCTAVDVPKGDAVCEWGGKYIDFSKGECNANNIIPSKRQYACNGKDGANAVINIGENYTNGDGRNCYDIETGLDTDHDGVIDKDRAVTTVCDGHDCIGGETITFDGNDTDLVEDSGCLGGGSYIDYTCNDGTSRRDYTCHGCNAMVTTRPATVEECPNGGGGSVTISWQDCDGDGKPSGNETVSESTPNCHGCLSAVALRDATVAECAEGGATFINYQDCDRDGTLDSGETILSTKSACNGHTPIITVEHLSEGSTHCPAGGTKVTIDGTVYYSCHGEDGESSEISVTNEPEGDNCAEGGIKVTVDGQDYYVCDGGTKVPPTYLCTEANPEPCEGFAIEGLVFTGGGAEWWGGGNPSRSSWLTVLDTSGKIITMRYRNWDANSDICRGSVSWNNGSFSGSGASCKDGGDNYIYSGSGRMYSSSGSWIHITNKGIITLGGGASHSNNLVCWTSRGGTKSCVGYNVNYKLDE
jgi:hypothetical protein